MSATLPLLVLAAALPVYARWSGRHPIMTIALMHPIWVRTYVEEPQLSRVRPGLSAWVTTDAATGQSYKGWIGFVSPVAEFTPRAVEDPHGSLLKGARLNTACDVADEFDIDVCPWAPPRV